MKVAVSTAGWSPDPESFFADEILGLRTCSIRGGESRETGVTVTLTARSSAQSYSPSHIAIAFVKPQVKFYNDTEPFCGESSGPIGERPTTAVDLTYRQSGLSVLPH